MNVTQHKSRLERLDSKWQYQRAMLLKCAELLTKDSTDKLWVKTQKDLEERLQNPDIIVRQKAMDWKKRAPNKLSLIQFILNTFGENPPEGPKRHKLQSMFEGYPFACIIPENVRKEIYQQAYYPHLQKPGLSMEP